MSRAIYADYIFNGKEYIKDGVVVFDKKIQDIITIDEAQKRGLEIEKYQDGYILYPGFVNTHVHLEFSANRTILKYGNFIKWLHSVIENRDEIASASNDEQMMKSCQEMLRSGITTFGAVSSFGLDLEVCKKTPQRVVYFNEAIGSIPSAVDVLFSDFKERLANSRSVDSSDRVTPAIAIHSPYSVHPILVSKVLDIARDLNLAVSAHFLESKAERDWLERGEGEFREFFKKFFNTSTPITDIESFLRQFDDIKTMFVHCTQANQEELNYIYEKGHTIAHCPRSNRLLGCGRLTIENIKAPLSLATDGYSSNWSLNIFDEMRAALIMHSLGDLNSLANRLMKSITSEAGESIGMDVGVLRADTPADMVLIKLPATTDIDSLALHTILHTKEVEKVWIDGEEISL